MERPRRQLFEPVHSRITRSRLLPAIYPNAWPRHYEKNEPKQTYVYNFTNAEHYNLVSTFKPENVGMSKICEFRENSMSLTPEKLKPAQRHHFDAIVGPRRFEIVRLNAGPGVGKTRLLKTIAQHMINNPLTMADGSKRTYPVVITIYKRDLLQQFCGQSIVLTSAQFFIRLLDINYWAWEEFDTAINRTMSFEHYWNSFIALLSIMLRSGMLHSFRNNLMLFDEVTTINKILMGALLCVCDLLHIGVVASGDNNQLHTVTKSSHALNLSVFDLCSLFTPDTLQLRENIRCRETLFNHYLAIIAHMINRPMNRRTKAVIAAMFTRQLVSLPSVLNGDTMMASVHAPLALSIFQQTLGCQCAFYRGYREYTAEMRRDDRVRKRCTTNDDTQQPQQQLDPYGDRIDRTDYYELWPVTRYKDVLTSIGRLRAELQSMQQDGGRAKHAARIDRHLAKISELDRYLPGKFLPYIPMIPGQIYHVYNMLECNEARLIYYDEAAQRVYLRFRLNRNTAERNCSSDTIKLTFDNFAEHSIANGRRAVGNGNDNDDDDDDDNDDEDDDNDSDYRLMRLPINNTTTIAATGSSGNDNGRGNDDTDNASGPNDIKKKEMLCLDFRDKFVSCLSWQARWAQLKRQSISAQFYKINGNDNDGVAYNEIRHERLRRHADRQIDRWRKREERLVEDVVALEAFSGDKLFTHTIVQILLNTFNSNYVRLERTALTRDQSSVCPIVPKKHEMFLLNNGNDAAKITLKRTVHGELFNFPIYPKFYITYYRSQGMTIVGRVSLIVDDKRGLRPLYVGASRVCHLNDINSIKMTDATPYIISTLINFQLTRENAGYIDPRDIWSKLVQCSRRDDVTDPKHSYFFYNMPKRSSANWHKCQRLVSEYSLQMACRRRAKSDGSCRCADRAHKPIDYDALERCHQQLVQISYNEFKENVVTLRARQIKDAELTSFDALTTPNASSSRANKIFVDAAVAAARKNNVDDSSDADVNDNANGEEDENYDDNDGDDDDDDDENDDTTLTATATATDTKRRNNGNVNSIKDDDNDDDHVNENLTDSISLMGVMRHCAVRLAHLSHVERVVWCHEYLDNDEFRRFFVKTGNIVHIIGSDLLNSNIQFLNKKLDFEKDNYFSPNETSQQFLERVSHSIHLRIASYVDVLIRLDENEAKRKKKNNRHGNDSRVSSSKSDANTNSGENAKKKSTSLFAQMLSSSASSMSSSSSSSFCLNYGSMRSTVISERSSSLGVVEIVLSTPEKFLLCVLLASQNDLYSERLLRRLRVYNPLAERYESLRRNVASMYNLVIWRHETLERFNGLIYNERFLLYQYYDYHQPLSSPQRRQDGDNTTKTTTTTATTIEPSVLTSKSREILSQWLDHLDAPLQQQQQQQQQPIVLEFIGNDTSGGRDARPPPPPPSSSSSSSNTSMTNNTGQQRRHHDNNDNNDITSLNIVERMAKRRRLANKREVVASAAAAAAVATVAATAVATTNVTTTAPRITAQIASAAAAATTTITTSTATTTTTALCDRRSSPHHNRKFLEGKGIASSPTVAATAAAAAAAAPTATMAFSSSSPASSRIKVNDGASPTQQTFARQQRVRAVSSTLSRDQTALLNKAFNLPVKRINTNSNK